jgi:tetratricopeptide (TPR) repeat protein
VRWDAAMLARHYDEAQAALDTFPLETMPAVFGAPLPKSYLEGITALARGDLRQAQTLLETARPSMEAEALANPENAIRHSRLGLLYAYMDRKKEALREGERAVALLPASSDAYEGPERMCDLALIHARVGDADQALDQIESLLQRPGCVSFYQASLSLEELRLRWQWDPLRANPRFQRILTGPEPKTIY